MGKSEKLFLMCCFANDVCLQWVLTWGMAAAILWMITYVCLDRLLVLARCDAIDACPERMLAKWSRSSSSSSGGGGGGSTLGCMFGDFVVRCDRCSISVRLVGV